MRRLTVSLLTLIISAVSAMLYNRLLISASSCRQKLLDTQSSVCKTMLDGKLKSKSQCTKANAIT
jgi:hypothetical protein